MYYRIVAHKKGNTSDFGTYRTNELTARSLADMILEKMQYGEVVIWRSISEDEPKTEYLKISIPRIRYRFRGSVTRYC